MGSEGVILSLFFSHLLYPKTPLAHSWKPLENDDRIKHEKYIKAKTAFRYTRGRAGEMKQKVSDRYYWCPLGTHDDEGKRNEINYNEWTWNFIPSVLLRLFNASRTSSSFIAFSSFIVVFVTTWVAMRVDQTLECLMNELSLECFLWSLCWRPGKKRLKRCH